MKALVPPLRVRATNGDHFEGDALDRKPLAENLTRLLQRSEDGLVMTVEGDWGSGKTEFLHMWHSVLSDNPLFVPIYYDAFANDFSSNPLVSLAGSIWRAVDDRVRAYDHRMGRDKRLKDLKTASKQLAAVAETTAGALVAGSSHGVVPAQGVAKVLGMLRDWLLRDSSFDRFLASDRLTTEYQTTLRAVLDMDEGKYRRIVVLVDELDRCRPLFAVEVIEKIKHFFNIRGVSFALAISPRQLIATIKATYGLEDIDAETYLQKFIDFGTSLPAYPSSIDHRLAVQVLVKGMLSAVGLIAGDRGLSGKDLEVFENVIRILELSPRGIHRSVSLVSLALHSCDVGEAKQVMRFVAFLAPIKVAQPKMFNEILHSGKMMEGGGATKRLFEYACSALDPAVEKTSSNVIEITGIRDAARLVNLYEVPGNRSTNVASELPADNQT